MAKTNHTDKIIEQAQEISKLQSRVDELKEKYNILQMFVQLSRTSSIIGLSVRDQPEKVKIILEKINEEAEWVQKNL